MDRPPDTLNDSLGKRLAQLERQLQTASGAASEHRNVEAGLRDALSYAQSIIDTVREPLLVLDGDLHVITASRAFYQVFEVSAEGTVGRFVYDLGNGQWDIPALRTALQEVLPQETSIENFEVVHDFPTLGRRVMLLNARKLWREGNGTERVLLAFEDVTKRKQMEEELLRSNEDLQRFVYVAAHDLRSPLNSALNLSKLLARRLEGKLNGEETAMQSLALQNLERLTALMQDLLTFSELAAVPRPMTMVPVLESLEIALANLQHHIEESGAELSVGAMPEVTGDRTQVAMLFQNLIGNAIKYRGAAPLRIRVEAEPADGYWRISVRDNGQGFEAKYAVQIFEPFKRLHGRNVPGSGIGLASCKRIVERFGGRIWAESAPNAGATFYFTLPA